jgi:hypothetical protein
MPGQARHDSHSCHCGLEPQSMVVCHRGLEPQSMHPLIRLEHAAAALIAPADRRGTEKSESATAGPSRFGV